MIEHPDRRHDLRAISDGVLPKCLTDGVQGDLGPDMSERGGLGPALAKQGARVVGQGSTLPHDPEIG